MNKCLLICSALLLLGAGCLQGPDVPKDSNLVRTEKSERSHSEPIVVEDIGAGVDEVTAPFIGGTERDRYGKREQCIINGDCDLGFVCIEGTCTDPDYY